MEDDKKLEGNASPDVPDPLHPPARRLLAVSGKRCPTLGCAGLKLSLSHGRLVAGKDVQVGGEPRGRSPVRLTVNISFIIFTSAVVELHWRSEI